VHCNNTIIVISGCIQLGPPYCSLWRQRARPRPCDPASAIGTSSCAPYCQICMLALSSALVTATSLIISAICTPFATPGPGATQQQAQAAQSRHRQCARCTQLESRDPPEHRQPPSELNQPDAQHARPLHPSHGSRGYEQACNALGAATLQVKAKQWQLACAANVPCLLKQASQRAQIDHAQLCCGIT
jgi:hypothetical protein